MEVTSKVLKNWKLLYEHGDISAIIEANDGMKEFTRYKVRNVIRGGTGHFTVVDAVSRYYKRKEKQQSKITV